MESVFEDCVLDMRRAFVIDDDAHIYQSIAAVLGQHGFTVENFQNAKLAIAALGKEPPGIIFLDIALLQSDAIDVLTGLGERQYEGVVHLMSGGRQQLLDAVLRLGTRHGIRLGASLNKPIDGLSIVAAVAALQAAIAQPRPTVRKIVSG